VRQKESLRDSARVALSAAQRRLIADIDEGYSEAKVARGQMDSLDQSVSTARESLRLVKLRYTAGESSVLEVVDAQNSLAATELAREDGVLRYQKALANLQILTGTLYVCQSIVLQSDCFVGFPALPRRACVPGCYF
jgi:outer membrane protein TolC